jgi:hypothetical protein
MLTNSVPISVDEIFKLIYGDFLDMNSWENVSIFVQRIFREMFNNFV